MRIDKNKRNGRPQSEHVKMMTLIPVSYTHLDVYKRQHSYETKYRTLMEIGERVTADQKALSY